MDIQRTNDPLAHQILIWANLFLLFVIVVHDGDHLRQARCWHYTISPELWTINCVVYLPSLVALFASIKRFRLAPYLTSFSGIFVAAGFAEVHLYRPSIPVWGIWNQNFFQLQVDCTSWSILVMTILAGIAVGMAGAFALGRISNNKILH